MNTTMKTHKKASNLVATSLGFFFILLIWIVISVIKDSALVFPNPIVTLEALFSLLTSSDTYVAILNTIGGLLLVALIGFICGLLLVLLTIKVPSIKAFLTPFLSLFKIVPIPALIIIFLISMKQAIIPSILTYIVLLPLFYDGLYGAFISINKDILDDLRTITPLTTKVMFNVYLPLVSKSFITTLLQALGLGLKVKVMSEFIAEAPNTIGYQLSFARATLAMDKVFAWSLVLIVFVVLLDLFLVYQLKKD